MDIVTHATTIAVIITITIILPQQYFCIAIIHSVIPQSSLSDKLDWLLTNRQYDHSSFALPGIPA
jgi:hypothetical protein